MPTCLSGVILEEEGAVQLQKPPASKFALDAQLPGLQLFRRKPLVLERRRLGATTAGQLVDAAGFLGEAVGEVELQVLSVAFQASVTFGVL